jgi:hypothetical protein
MDYKRLYETWKAEATHGKDGNVQDRIARAKGVSRQLVSFRLICSALPEKVIKQIARNDFLKEGHAAEIIKLPESGNLAPWYDRQEVMADVVSTVIENKGKKAAIKVLVDALQGIAYSNDSQVSELHAYLHDDKARPRVEVNVWATGEP